MEISLLSLLILPAGLGLLGFIEPCTIGGHLVFLETQKPRSPASQRRALGVFIAVRTLVAGLFGAGAALLGQWLIGVQTGLWLVFGLLYLALGFGFLLGYGGRLKQRIDLAPERWKRASSPFVLGVAFGLNIPACAAPILFVLLGLAASSGAVLAGFLQMAIFGLFLSLPLLLFVLFPRLGGSLARLGGWFGKAGRVIGGGFIALGLWSIWFGLNVNPADWAGI